MSGLLAVNEPPDCCCESEVQACCLPGGICQVLTPLECAALGGLAQGPGTICTPNPCAGACCFASGNCQALSQLECSAQGGSFQGAGVSCIPNPCMMLGACCLPFGGCVDVTAEQCATAGGVFLGPVPCSPTLCLPASSCGGAGVCPSTFIFSCAATGNAGGGCIIAITGFGTVVQTGPATWGITQDSVGIYDGSKGNITGNLSCFLDNSGCLGGLPPRIFWVLGAGITPGAGYQGCGQTIGCIATYHIALSGGGCSAPGPFTSQPACGCSGWSAFASVG